MKRQKEATPKHGGKEKLTQEEESLKTIKIRIETKHNNERKTQTNGSHQRRHRGNEEKEQQHCPCRNHRSTGRRYEAHVLKNCLVEKGEREHYETKKMVYRIAVQTALSLNKLIDI